MITSMDHFTIVTDQLELTRRFYTDLLELRVGQRPDFPVPGIWLYLKDEPVLHVIEVKEMPVPRRGVLDHMAFSANDLIRTLGSLQKHQVTFRIIRTPGTLTWQVFFYDPNGVEVELDFAPHEAPPGNWKALSSR